MAHAYTPGLKVAAHELISKRRILPLKGEVVAKVGDKVKPDDVVARTYLPGDVEPINVANQLGLPPEDVASFMLKKLGDPIAKGEIIAQTKPLFGLSFLKGLTNKSVATLDGTIESISSVTGQVLQRGKPIPVEVKAYLNGEVIEVFEKEGAVICSWGSFIQGIFGIGGETHGTIKVVVPDNQTRLQEKHITDECKGCIIIGGSRVTANAIKKAVKVGAKGVVTGGFDDKDLREFLGYDIGVAITGSENLGVSLVITEGFGDISMAGKTFELLKSKEGMMGCINGATQIRAGVIRPEAVIPTDGDIHATDDSKKYQQHGLEIGSPIRVIRHPYFGDLGKVTNLPSPLHVLESGSKARILEVEFEDGKRAIVPRANVELIES
ncbi:MAG: hypothetical protein KAR42_02320 [candidate division Zixibacteria bacterium]|nr:hypothetical protein [candidate division Zixibacteria bacterium]